MGWHPGGGALSQEGIRRLFPFQSRFFQVGIHRLHYIDEGNGPLLLMMHACPFWSFEFRMLINILREDHRVIAVDQMGFGLSDKPENFDYRLENHVDHLDRFTRELGLKDITLILHGRGAAIGMAFSIRHPEDIRGFITFNTIAFSGYSLPLRLQFCRLKWFGSKFFMDLVFLHNDLKHLNPDIRNAYRMPFPTLKSKIAFVHFLEDIPCVPEDASARSMFEIESALWLFQKKPMCIIWAKHDWLYREKSLEKWRRYFPEFEIKPRQNDAGEKDSTVPASPDSERPAAPDEKTGQTAHAPTLQPHAGKESAATGRSMGSYTALWIWLVKKISMMFSCFPRWKKLGKNKLKWERRPDVEVHIIKNAGRCITEDAPEELEKIIRTFLAKHSL